MSATMRAMSGRAWLVVGAALVLGACDFVTVDPTLLYLKEADGGCAVAGQYPWSDGFCHFGPEGLSDAGPRDGGGSGGNGDATDAGGGTGGGTDAGPVDAGCMPTTCAANGWNCGLVDAGCGVQLSCGACDPARFEACGVGGVPNVCAPAEICSDDGWCWQNPLPQGNTLRAVWVNGPNDVWTGGDHGTLLHWDGEKWSRLAIPPPYSTILGVASFGSNVWIIADSRILRWDGLTWQSEKTGTSTWTAIAGTSATNLFAVSGSVLSARSAGGTWTDTGLPTLIYSGSSLWVDANGDVFVAGQGGLFRFTGGAFGADAEVNGSIVSIAGIPNGPVFAVFRTTDIDPPIYRRNDAGMWNPESSCAYRVDDGGTEVGVRFPQA